MLSAFSPPCLYFSFVHCLSAVSLALSFIRLYVRTLPKFQNLSKLKSTNKPLLIFILALTYPHFSFVISLSARVARTVICSSFVRHLFVHCSFIVRLLFVLCSFIVRLSFVLCSSFVRLFIICPCRSHRLLFVFPISSLYLHYFILPSPFAN